MFLDTWAFQFKVSSLDIRCRPRSLVQLNHGVPGSGRSLFATLDFGFSAIMVRIRKLQTFLFFRTAQAWAVLEWF